MKRKLLTLAIPMLLITGVGCESNDKKKDEVMEASVKANKKEDYGKNATYLLKDYTEQTEEIKDLVDSRKSNKKKAEKLKELSKPYFELIDKIDKLDYQLGEDNKTPIKVSKAMIYSKSGLEKMQTGLEENDEDSIEFAKKNLDEASEIVDKATKELSKNK
ncbi:hypothetical protein [Bacillus cereus group sp. BY32LC]|uniref:hypothetical protein n=1 Tax=Bacillus cereus group sp. BY32LC TaxID=3018079 RepID=UPI0022E7A1F7|nr:hypothetical protein [Bacillus cereus group sp. BY32LC]MDA1804245.1 hypothetical protein [Bacillus cereus group sp. BY32LC]